MSVTMHGSGTARPLRPGRGAFDAAVFVAIVAGVLAATGLPYLYGYLAAGPGQQFMGIIMNVPDTAQYFSWAHESSRGLLIENKLTPEHGDAVFFNLFWLAVGRFAALFGAGIAETAAVVRLLAGAVYFGAIYWFIGLVVQDRLQRWVATLVATLGGGLGWLLVVHKYFTDSAEVAFPLDLYVTEANTFLSVLAFPHQAMAGGLLVLTLGVAMLAFERRSFGLATASGLLALFLGVQHGYDLLIVYGVTGSVALMIALRERPWVRPLALCVAICGWSVPAALYLAFITRTSPIWKGALAQYGNAGVYTPNPLHLLVLMGLPLVLAVWGMPSAALSLRRGGLSRALTASPRELLLWTWLVLGFFLLYIPTDFQIKMLVGWQVPVSIFGTRVLFSQVVPRLGALVGEHRRRLGLMVGCLFIVAAMPVNAYLFAWRLVDLARHEYPYYLHRDEVAALRWLSENSDRSDVVLSSLTIGQYVPSISGNNAFLAHWAMTLDFYDKRRMVSLFFNAATPDEYRAEVLRRFDVSYVIHGAAERALGSYKPDTSPYLTRVFASPGADVYAAQPTGRTEATSSSMGVQ